MSETKKILVTDFIKKYHDFPMPVYHTAWGHPLS